MVLFLYLVVLSSPYIFGMFCVFSVFRVIILVVFLVVLILLLYMYSVVCTRYWLYCSFRKEIGGRLLLIVATKLACSLFGESRQP